MWIGASVAAKAYIELTMPSIHAVPGFQLLVPWPAPVMKTPLFEWSLMARNTVNQVKKPRIVRASAPVLSLGSHFGHTKSGIAFTSKGDYDFVKP